jgi:hypothetical protein
VPGLGGACLVASAIGYQFENPSSCEEIILIHLHFACWLYNRQGRQCIPLSGDEVEVEVDVKGRRLLVKPVK